jgi:hypothetical protein
MLWWSDLNIETLHRTYSNLRPAALDSAKEVPVLPGDAVDTFFRDAIVQLGVCFMHNLLSEASEKLVVLPGFEPR